MAIGNDIKKQVIIAGVGLVGAYLVYRFIVGSVKDAASGAVSAVKETVVSGYNVADAGVIQLSNKISDATGVKAEGHPYLTLLANANPVAAWGGYLGNKLKDGIIGIYDWATDSEDDPKINVYDDSSKTVNGIPIYIVKPEGAPQSIFTLESLSKDIPFLNVK